ncbi:hypothetical protein SFR_3736 [Streptomyces sp. FR-008]|nr:hypothetical protein SFR_3736 [Streptomyces sp. FR-008]
MHGGSSNLRERIARRMVKWTATEAVPPVLRPSRVHY